MRISVVIPVLNEAGYIASVLAPLQALRAAGHEIIVVDGGSEDGTGDLPGVACDRLLAAPRGRARQMNAGARAASGDILWFLYGDTVPSANAVVTLMSLAGATGWGWGRFDVRLSGTHPLLSLVAALMNRRSRWSGIATGDQGIFVRRGLFDRVGAFPEVALMEDIALSRLLKHECAPLCCHEQLLTSARRWERDGVLRTILRMWVLRFAYWRGVAPERLARHYRRG